MLVIRQATTTDASSILSLLQTEGLRTEGVLEAGTRYWIAGEGPGLVGAIGLELGEMCVLLRSAIVVASQRGRCIGRKLTEHTLQWACKNGYKIAYCFSTDAGGYWTDRGFNRCPVEEVVRAMPNAPQVQLFDRLGWLPSEVAYSIVLAEME